MDLREEVWVSCVPTEMMGDFPLSGMNPMKVPGTYTFLLIPLSGSLMGEEASAVRGCRLDYPGMGRLKGEEDVKPQLELPASRLGRGQPAESPPNNHKVPL